MRKLSLVSAATAVALTVLAATPAMADPFDWIYGLTNAQATERLERQGFIYVSQDDNYYYWHRKAYCVRFRSVEGIVADATEMPPGRCKLPDDGDDNY